MVTEADGGGLHLSISRRIVETMGGRIQVESQVGKGEHSTLLPGLIWTEVHDLNDSVGSHPEHYT
jgi:nitrogen-specific signal transduction histidine kinase